MKSAIASETDLVTRLDDAMATLDFLVNLSFVIALFAVEALLVNSWLHQWKQAVFMFPFFVLAYVVYRAAVAQARSWGDLVQTVFDIYRSKLSQQLGVRKFSSLEDEREAWSRVSGWILWGDNPGDAFAVNTSAPAITITPSDNITVKPVETILTETVEPAQLSSRYEWSSFSNYLFFVSPITTIETSPAPLYWTGSAYFIVSDPRILTIERAPSAAPEGHSGIEVTSLVLPAGKPSPAPRLLWRIERMPRSGSIAISYKLLQRAFSAKTTHPDLHVSARIIPNVGKSRFRYIVTVRTFLANFYAPISTPCW